MHQCIDGTATRDCLFGRQLCTYQKIERRHRSVRIFSDAPARPIKSVEIQRRHNISPRLRSKRRAIAERATGNNRRAMFCHKPLCFRLSRVALEDFRAAATKVDGFLARFDDSPTCCSFGASFQPLYTCVVLLCGSPDANIWPGLGHFVWWKCHPPRRRANQLTNLTNKLTKMSVRTNITDRGRQRRQAVFAAISVTTT